MSPKVWLLMPFVRRRTHRVAPRSMILFRPVGKRELDLIAASGYRRFPPRLSHQPIFYPVLERAYATQIARDWNTQDEASGFAGFVTQFEIPDELAARYDVQTVGSRQHRELWVPAVDLEEFNDHLLGPIVVVESHYGERFAGPRV